MTRTAREHDIRYSRTYVMYLVPLAVILTIGWCIGLWTLIAGLTTGDFEKTVGGGFVTVAGSVVLWISWRNALQASATGASSGNNSTSYS